MDREPVRVVVVGCGGTGSWFVHGLVRQLDTHNPGSVVVLVDGDSYEEKNKERQAFSRLGNKAEVLRLDLAEQNPNTLIIAQAAWVVSDGMETEVSEDEEQGVIKLSPYQLLEEGDWVFPLVDNFAARALLFNAAKDYDDITVITAGNEDDLSGSMWHYVRKDGVDVTPHPGEIHDEFNNPPGKNPGELSCQERAKLDGGTQVLAANMACAAWLLSKVSTCMLGTDEQREESQQIVELFFDMATGRSLPYNWPVSTRTLTDV